MKIASLLHGYNPDFDERKRATQRKEAGDVYKKHAKYADANKNPMLQALEDLLSGKTEKNLHKADQEARQESQQTVAESKDEYLEQPKVKMEISQLKQTEKEVIAHENAHKSAGPDVTGAVTYEHTIGPDDKRYINGGEVAIQLPAATDDHDETLKLLEKVRQAALAPAQPSPQDLRVAANATAQMQHVRTEQSIEEAKEQADVAPFANEDLSFDMPEKFQKDFARDPQQQTMFNQSFEQLSFQRTFAKATQTYNAQIAMVKNGYRSTMEPSFSHVA